MIMKLDVFDKIKTNKNIKVSVICFTYNHEPYIRRTIEQIINQKTNFDFELIIHDDNSTDGTKEIVKEYYEKYPNKIRALLENENQYLKGIDVAQEIVWPMINGKYVCSCEGDDYWIPLNKIQKQYDFLINNLNYCACAGVTRYIDDDGKEVLKQKPYSKFCGKDLKENDFLSKKKAQIEINTMMYDRKLLYYKPLLQARNEKLKIGDLLLIMCAFENGKIYVFNELFQTHTVQTRKNSSNFSSIFSYKQKYEFAIAATNSIRFFNKKHDMKSHLRIYNALFFYYSILHFSLKDFFECYKKIIPEYREPLLLCLIKAIPDVWIVSSNCGIDSNS